MKGPVAWYDNFRGHGDAGTCAWVFMLAEAGPIMPFEPTARDSRDVGGRKGEDARRFLSRRAALRQLVGRRCGVPPETVEIGYERAGRPIVLSPKHGPFCSVSARGELTALALSSEPVGIDVEPIEPAEVPWAVLAEAEAARIRSLPTADQAAAFLEVWTIKEAYLKARGSGLLAEPAHLLVDIAHRTIVDHGRHVALQPSALRPLIRDKRKLVAACVTAPG